MAYTLGDPFRSLRLMLRIHGFLVGIGLGLLLLAAPRTLLLSWGVYESGPQWPLRLAGASQLGLGIFFFLTANQDYLSKVTLLTTVVTNALFALVLLSAYFQQELTNLTSGGQIIFVLVFVLYLIGAVLPLRYLRSSD